MKQKYLAFAVAAGAMAASSAHAQSNVQLYGLMDLSVPTYQSHADANGNHVIGIGGVVLIGMGVLIWTGEFTTMNVTVNRWLQDIGLPDFNSDT